MHIDQAISFCAFLVGVAVAVSSAEFLSVIRRYADNDVLSWHVAKHQSLLFQTRWFSPVAGIIFSARGFRVLLVVRLIASVATALLSAYGYVSPVLLGLMWLTTTLVSIRSPFGLDGAHQMGLIVLSALTLATSLRAWPFVPMVCAWFIAIQLASSYAIAGVAKLCDPVWRNGLALRGIFSTSIYGHPVVYRVFRKSVILSVACCWLTIIFECSFPIVFFLDIEHAQYVVAIAITFHAFNAVFMGLNGFFYSFVAAYPALLWSILP